MPLASYALTTLAAVKAYIGGQAQSTTTDDSIVEDMINAASELLIIATGREFRSLSTSATRVVEVNADGTVDLGGYELRAVSSITANPEGSSPTALTAADYQLTPVDITSGGGYRGLRLFNGYRHPGDGHVGTVSITGSWGWQTVPASIELLCRVQVKQWYDRDKQNRSDIVATDGSQQVSYSPALGLSPSVRRAAVEAWSVPVVA